MAIKVKHQPKWNDAKIIIELKKILNQSSNFPTLGKLKQMKRYDLTHTISKHGGLNKFRKLIGASYLRKPKGYWKEEVIIKELKLIIEQTGHFPNRHELEHSKKYDLLYGIFQNGGLIKFKILMGYYIHKKRKWDDDNIQSELKGLIDRIGYFPTAPQLDQMGRQDLRGAMIENGGTIKFRKLLGCKLPQKPRGYWTDKIIMDELLILTKELQHFPSNEELDEISRQDLRGAMINNGGTTKFRRLLGYELPQKPQGYWTEDIIADKLRSIASQIGRFPSISELVNEDGGFGLVNAMRKKGNIGKYRKMLGYTTSMREKHVSELRSYINKRGKKCELIIKQILIDYCQNNGLTEPKNNVKLSKNNVIEFVCDNGKSIGIDVTNTENEFVVRRKWEKKLYYKYLNELWIVVFSEDFKDAEYINWNVMSPSNVKVMSVYDFLDELDYSLNESIRDKIEMYCKCSFRTKEELISKDP